MRTIAGESSLLSAPGQGVRVRVRALVVGFRFEQLAQRAALLELLEDVRQLDEARHPKQSHDLGTEAA